MSEYKLLINGELVNSSSGKTVDDIGPATGEPIAQVPESSVEDVDRAVAAAREAFDDGRWSEPASWGARRYPGETGVAARGTRRGTGRAGVAGCRQADQAGA